MADEARARRLHARRSLARHGALARPGDGLSVGSRAELRDHRALHHRGSLRGRRRDRARTISTRSRTSSAISCCRSSITRSMASRKTDASTSPTWSMPSPRKMIRRHPACVRGREPQGRRFSTSGIWERIKAEEKAARGERRRERGVRARRCAGRPARAHARGQAAEARGARSASTGRRLRPCLPRSRRKSPSSKRRSPRDARGGAPASRMVTEEFGDLLFVMANVARHLGVDPEAALRDANAKFVRRFRSIEAALGRTAARPRTRRSRRWISSGTRPRRPRRTARCLFRREPEPRRRRRGGRAGRASPAPRGCAKR